MSHPYDRQGDIAVITLHNPPVNGLSHELRSAIVAGLDAAAADTAIKAVILIGSSRAFSGGADIREFNTVKGLAAPTLPAVIAAVEASAKPVLAAIGGVCMGGGLELALGCHYRLALADATIALPEVKLGLLPGAGGTQRLPRLLGGQAALRLIVSGEALPAKAFTGTALFDELVDGNLFEAALAFARRLIDAAQPPRRTRELAVDAADIAEFLKVYQRTLSTLNQHYPAQLKCAQAVHAAMTRPFDEGMAIEGELFQYLVHTNESKALRHAFFAERSAAKLDGIPEQVQARAVARVGVVGAGTMGGGITMSLLNAGLPVTLLEVKEDALNKGVAAIRKAYEGAVKKGKLQPSELEPRLALLTPTLSYDGLKDADLIIEAVFEDMGVKEQVFKALDRVAKPGAILASNTSTLDIDRIAAFTSRPGDVLGLHFFSPAHIMKLLEVVRGAKTAPDVLVTAMALAKKLRKSAVVSGVCDGFIGNRMIAAYVQQAMELLEEGASPQQIDQALEAWGMAMGPFRMGDLAGNDIGWAIRKRQQAERPDPHYPRIADRLCELGRFGQKAGAGWYRYEAGSRDAAVDSVTEDLIAAYRQEKGLQARTINATEIVERCVFALINEGARLLKEGIAQRASDIDIVYLSGYGFPTFRGGPMFYADTLGLKVVIERMQEFKEQTRSDFWQPAPLLLESAQSGRTLQR